VHPLTHKPIWRVLLLIVGLTASFATRADPISALQTLRLGGCGGILPAARPLTHEAKLDNRLPRRQSIAATRLKPLPGCTSAARNLRRFC
jgi:hypothetical protein